MTLIPFHQRLSSVNLDQRPSENSAILTETNPQLLLGTFWLRQSLLSSGLTALSIGATSCWSYPQADISYTYLRTIYITLIYAQYFSHSFTHNKFYTLTCVCVFVSLQLQMHWLGNPAWKVVFQVGLMLVTRCDRGVVGVVVWWWVVWQCDSLVVWHSSVTGVVVW